MNTSIEAAESAMRTTSGHHIILQHVSDSPYSGLPRRDTQTALGLQDTAGLAGLARRDTLLSQYTSVSCEVYPQMSFWIREELFTRLYNDIDLTPV